MIVILAVSALLSAAIVVACNWSRIGLFSKESELYNRFKDRDGYDVVYLKDVAISDTTTTDVTVIEAHDSTR